MKKALFIDLMRKTEYEFDKGILTKTSAILAKDNLLIALDKITGDELYHLDEDIGHKFYFMKKGILVKKDELYGLYSYDGKCILPVKFDEVHFRKEWLYLREKDRFYLYYYETEELDVF